MSVIKLPDALRDEMQNEVTIDTARLLTQAALMAAQGQQLAQAQQIIDGLVPVFGNYAVVGMAQATVMAATGRKHEALATVETLAAKFPSISGIRCVQALLRKDLGQSGWVQIAESVVAEHEDPQAVEAASRLLEDAPRRGARLSAPSLATVGLRFA